MLCAAGAPVRHVYFPHRGVVALSARAIDSPAVGAGLVRTDGMFGLGAAAGRATSNVLAVSQGPGRGDRIETRAFRRLLPDCPELRGALFAYAASVAAQMSQDTACVAFHSSRQRVARWMIDATEDGHGPAFHATQAAIGIALGLQRATVNHASAELQRGRVIRYLRGDVTILDRPALRAVACGCSLRFPIGARAARRADGAAR